MKKVIISFTIILFILLVGFVVPQTLESNSSIDPKYAGAGISLTNNLLSNPLERKLIQKTVATKIEGDSMIVKAYTFFGITYAEVRVLDYKKGMASGVEVISKF